MIETVTSSSIRVNPASRESDALFIAGPLCPPPAIRLCFRPAGASFVPESQNPLFSEMNEGNRGESEQRQTPDGSQSEPTDGKHLSNRPEEEGEAAGHGKDHEEGKDRDQRKSEPDKAHRVPFFVFIVTVPAPADMPASGRVAGCGRRQNEMAPGPDPHIERVKRRVEPGGRQEKRDRQDDDSGQEHPGFGGQMPPPLAVGRFGLDDFALKISDLLHGSVPFPGFR